MPTTSRRAALSRPLRPLVSLRISKPALAFAFACLTAMVAAGHAQPIDPHRLYEQNCGGCHTQHAGDFVHDNLEYSDGNIIGSRSDRELRAFLEAGHGRLSPDEVEAMVVLLTGIQQSGRLFHDKCIICHDRAVVLARRELILRDGQLIGRYTDRDIEQFLSGHGRLTSDEVSKMVEVLKRHLGTRER